MSRVAGQMAVVGWVGVALVGFLGAQTVDTAVERILAVVNGHVILRSDVRAFRELGLLEDVDPNADETTVVTYLVERRVVLDQVDRFYTVEPESALVDARVEQLVARLPSGVSLDDVLARSGLTRADLTHLLADELRREAYLENRFDTVAETRRGLEIARWVDDLVSRAQIRLSP